MSARGGVLLLGQFFTLFSFLLQYEILYRSQRTRRNMEAQLYNGFTKRTFAPMVWQIPAWNCLI